MVFGAQCSVFSVRKGEKVGRGLDDGIPGWITFGVISPRPKVQIAIKVGTTAICKTRKIQTDQSFDIPVAEQNSTGINTWKWFQLGFEPG